MKDLTKSEVYKQALKIAEGYGYKMVMRFGTDDGFQAVRDISVERKRGTSLVTMGIQVHINSETKNISFAFNHMTNKGILIANNDLGSFDNEDHFRRHEYNFEDALHALYSEEYLFTAGYQ